MKTTFGMIKIEVSEFDHLWEDIDIAALVDAVNTSDSLQNKSEVICDGITEEKVLSWLQEKPQTLEELMSRSGLDHQRDTTYAKEMDSVLSSLQNDMTVYLNKSNEYCLL